MCVCKISEQMLVFIKKVHFQKLCDIKNMNNCLVLTDCSSFSPIFIKVLLKRSLLESAAHAILSGHTHTRLHTGVHARLHTLHARLHTWLTEGILKVG